MASDASTRNVARQLTAPGSLLNFFRALLKLRRGSPALREGRYQTLPSHPDVFAYLRVSATDARLVALNMTATVCDLALGPDRIPDAMDSDTWSVALGSHRAPGTMIRLKDLRLGGFEALLLKPHVGQVTA
jgi:alpha-glucosidase